MATTERNPHHDRRRRPDVLQSADEPRFRELIDALPSAIYTTDAEGLLTHFNAAAARFAGRTPEPGTDRWCVSGKLYHPDGTPMPHSECPMAIAMKSGRALQHAEGVAERPDGERVRFAAYPTPIRNEDGELIGGINVLIDITDLKATEEVLLKQKRMAEAARQEAEAARAEAEKARVQAEEANRAKSLFLATMSHELRTPLNAIMGYVDLLGAGIGGPITDIQREHLDRVTASSRHLLQLIEEVLTFSRLQANRENIDLSTVDLLELVSSTAALVEPLAQTRGLAFDTVVVPDRPTVRTDARKVRQILLNLLSNAVKFTEEGGVHLEVRVSDNGDTTIRVRDTGVGIPPEQQERIFEAFSQVEQLSSSRPGGTGLGLSVTRQLARLLGGDVEIQKIGRAHV